jgi:4-amino-4-deoxy-L-arabinose transferase-like glycosyltransferase
MTLKETTMQYRAEILLVAILLFSAFLNFWNVWNQGFSNAYYAAAVRSMLENPGIAFFNSYDPAGFVTIDKPPVGLWVQALSAVIFGYSGWALVLPQALAGVGSVALVYAIVSRPFGKPAGLVSAFALAVTPIFVAVSRNGTMDGILIFVLLLALRVALKAAQDQSLPLLLLSVSLIGVGFNIKMIQAFIVVPAVLVIYFLAIRDAPWKKQALHLGLALVVLLGVSLSWAVAVDMIPASERPYIGGSGDNTVLGLIINYNGLHRLENGGMGGAGGPGGTMAGSGGPIGSGAPTGLSTRNGSGSPPDSQDRSSFTGPMMQNRTGGGTGTGNTAPPGMMASFGQQGQSGMGQQPSAANGPTGSAGNQARPGGMNGGGGGMDNSGNPGVFRLFNSGLAGQITWLLPFALIGLLAWWRRPATLSFKGLEEAGLFSERGLVLIGAGLWLLPGLMYFSFTTGFWHTYYIATIAPPLAMLVGIGALGLYESWCHGGGGSGWLLVAAVAVTGVIQLQFLSYSQPWSDICMMILIPAVVIASILLAVMTLRKTSDHGYRRAIPAAAIAILFLATTIWAFTPLVYGDGGNLPVAGPQQNRGNGGMGNAFSGTGDGTSQLAEYLLAHRSGETWIVAVSSSMGEGANLIIKTGEPVMSLGGFSGSDQILTVDSLKDLIDDGKIRYFLGSGSGGGSGPGGGNSEIFTWVSGHCTEVPAADWGGSSRDLSSPDTQPASGNMTSLAFPGSGGALVPGSSPDNTGRITPPVSGNMTTGLSGSGSITFRNIGGPGGANTLYDCAGYTGQA